MLDGHTSFAPWKLAVRAQSPDILDRIAEKIDATPETVLRAVYGYAGEVAGEYGANIPGGGREDLEKALNEMYPGTKGSSPKKWS